MSRPATVFIGFMGAGKTTAARELDPGATDVDAEIAAREGRTTSEIFASEGERGFRLIEERETLAALERAGGGSVALGGGAVLSEAVREALREHTVVWLDIDAATAWQRVSAEASTPELRPLARDREEFERLHAERREIYAGLADAVFDVPEPGAVARAAPALEALGRLPRGTRMLWASSRSGEYPVFAGPGLLGPAGFGLIPSSPAVGEPGKEGDGAREGGAEMEGAAWPARGRRFVVTDENVRAALGVVGLAGPAEPDPGVSQRSGEEASTSPPTAAADVWHAIPPGEETKTLATAGEVLEAMAAAGLTRADHVVALAGGMVGDLGGFCAATYQRGIPVVQVPTTVVGQVDSAYGGKTGVDLPQAKNYVGAYHMPAAVIADTATLDTLPEAELAAGFVEALKTGLLAGGRLWEAVQEIEPRSASALAGHPFLIFDCARYKCAVVADDERDAGLRQVLNLGHTVGHALEAATGYARYRHGEAIGLGLLAALRLSGAGELREQVRGILERWGLPVRIEPPARGSGPGGASVPEPGNLQEAIALDKKRVGESVPFVLLERPGEPRFGQGVDLESVTAAIEELYE